MIIKSSENLCKNYDELSKLAHSVEQPIFITREGEGDLVIFSIETYETLFAESIYCKNDIKKGDDNMTTHKLGLVLKEMYNNSPKGQQVTNIHTFAIYYADVMEKEKISKKEVLKIAGLPESYQTEISKGINLASYVEVKQMQKERIKKIEKDIDN